MSEIEPNEMLDETIEKTVYEAGFLLDPALSEEEATAKQEALKGFISSKGAEIIAEGTPLSQKLAYTIEIKKDSKRKDFTKAHFSWIKFDLLPEEISSIDTLLKTDEHVIRFLIVTTVRENTLREPLEDEEGFVSEEEDSEEVVVEETSDEEAPKVEDEVVI